MKARYISIVLLIAVAALLLWWLTHRPANLAPQQPDKVEASQSNLPPMPTQANQVQTSVVSATNAPTPENDFTAWNEKRMKQMSEDMEKGKDEWRTPIEFYGKVVDESTNPVVGAQVDFSCNDLSAEGTSNYHSISDGNGVFSITGIAGKLLVVSVTKGGYYTSKRDNDSFYYAGQNVNFVPDANNPVIFHLRKKGVAEPLIHVQAAMGGAKDFIISKDGTAVEISLSTGKTTLVGQGDLMVQCWTDDQGKSLGQKYDWRCQISVPNGGILQSSNEFDFQAPLEGYQPSDEINMSVSLEGAWGNHVQRKYFLKLANGNYARMNFEIIAAGGHIFAIESFLNQSGSRNLEFDPNNTIPAGN